MKRSKKHTGGSILSFLTAGSLLAGVTASAAQYPMGDTDANGTVDIVDALSILVEYTTTVVMMQPGTFTEQQLAAADINHDGAIDAVDALNALQYYVAGDIMENPPEDWEYYEVEDSAATTTTTTEVITTTTTTTASTYETDTTNNCVDWEEYVIIDGVYVDAVPGQKNVPVTITVDINSFYYEYSKIELRVSYDPVLMPSCTDGKIEYDFGGYFDDPDALVTVESDDAEIVITAESTDGFNFGEGRAFFTLYFDIPDDAELGWRSVNLQVEQLIDCIGEEVPWVDLSFISIHIVEPAATTEVTTTTITITEVTTTTTTITEVTTITPTTTTISTEPIDDSVTQYVPDSDLWYTLVDGVLTIGGVGDMPEFETRQGPWEHDKTITAVYVNEGVTSIADYAFSYCTNLAEVYVPASVSRLGLWAFYRCDSLQMIEVAEDNAYYSSINGVLFDKDQMTILLYPYNANAEYSIPKGVQTIGYAAFQSHPTLTALTIPDSVIFIEEGAFVACESLTDVYYTGTEEQWNAIVDECGFDLSITTIHFNS
ncbi:MAG: leucine-rich repeat protein [Oscillospiraceae bacterium]|nr:leucine-rich repeat protein [Oscillospiraceae bacterium]